MTENYIPGSNLGVTSNGTYLLDLWVNMPAGESFGPIEPVTRTDNEGKKYLDVALPIVSDSSKGEPWTFNQELELQLEPDTIYILNRVMQGAVQKGSGRGGVAGATSR